MAKAVRISVSSVQRIWRVHGLQLHRVRQSNDPKFVTKLRDIVRLYVNPPDHASFYRSMRRANAARG
jgi:hypothetical protein